MRDIRIVLSQTRAVLLVLLAAFIPFGTRKFLFHFTNGFDEYESIFLYGTDFLIALLVLLCLFAWRRGLFDVSLGSLALFFFAAGLSIFWAYHPVLGAYAFSRLVLAALLAVIALISLSSAGWYRRLCGALAASAIFQSLIGIQQFFTGASVGLHILGESQLGPTTPGVARVLTEFGRMLRAYGTMPHANIYAAFILLGLVSILWLWISSGPTRPKELLARIARNLFYAINTFILVVGLTVSFSRSGWISAAVACVVLFALGLITPRLRLVTVQVALSLLLCAGAAYALLHFAISPRIAMTTSADYSISSRLTYNQMAVSLIRSQPLGVGMGNQVLYSVENELYQDAGMTRVFEWQPIHNLYLLIATETGILGLALFAVFVGILGVRMFRALWVRRKFENNSPLIHAAALCAGLLVFGLSDHFLWDLQPGRLMLWLTLGLALSALHLSSSDKN